MKRKRCFEISSRPKIIVHQVYGSKPQAAGSGDKLNADFQVTRTDCNSVLRFRGKSKPNEHNHAMLTLQTYQDVVGHGVILRKRDIKLCGVTYLRVVIVVLRRCSAFET